MALSNPKTIFGIHSITPYSRTTGEPMGMARVIGEASIGLQGELQKLFGGSSPFPWASEIGTISSEIAIKIREYPDFLFEAFLGKKPTIAGVDANGTVSTITNVKGSSVVAATGIATATVKAAVKADLKFTKYLVKATDATHVDVYAMSDIDFDRGTDKTFVGDDGKITTTPLQITQGAPVEIPGFGIELTGGAGIIALVAGDTASFEVLPPSAESMSVVIGGAKNVYPEIGLLMMAQKQGTQEMFEIDVFRAKGIGLPIQLAEKAFSEAEIKPEALYDSKYDGIFKIRRISF